VALNLILALTPGAGESDLRNILTGRGVSLESQFRLTYSMILNLMRVEDLKVGGVASACGPASLKACVLACLLACGGPGGHLALSLESQSRPTFWVILEQREHLWVCQAAAGSCSGACQLLSSLAAGCTGRGGAASLGSSGSES